LDSTAYSDGEYEDNDKDMRSASGTGIAPGGTAVSWARSTQRSVTLSTAEADYVALGETVKTALFRGHVSVFAPRGALRWLRTLLVLLGLRLSRLALIRWGATSWEGDKYPVSIFEEQNAVKKFLASAHLGPTVGPN